MEKKIKFYQELDPMECLQGDTLKTFQVTTAETNGTMKMILEDISVAGSIAIPPKECSKIAGEDETVFTVQLTSVDTENLSGTYRLHFVLTENDLQYKKLTGTLTVIPVAHEQEGA